jgi:hypothetical protein
VYESPTIEALKKVMNVKYPLVLYMEKNLFAIWTVLSQNPEPIQTRIGKNKLSFELEIVFDGEYVSKSNEKIPIKIPSTICKETGSL